MCNIRCSTVKVLLLYWYYPGNSIYLIFFVNYMQVSLILFIYTQKILSGYKTKFLLKKCDNFFVDKFIPVASFKIYYNWLKQCLQTHTSKSENKKGKQTRCLMLVFTILKLGSQGWKISVRSNLTSAVQQVSSQSGLFIVRHCLQQNKTTRSSKLCLLSQRGFLFKELTP